VFVFAVGECDLVEDPAGDVPDLLFVEAETTADGWFRVAEDRCLERVAQPAAEREPLVAAVSNVVNEPAEAVKQRRDGRDEATVVDDVLARAVEANVGG
jgi:hypothetical protein